MSKTNSTRRHPSFKDLTGERFGKWTVLCRDTSHPSKAIYWNCRCDCGIEKPVKGSSLTGDRSHGCNPCGKRQHGMTGTTEHCSWLHMKQRCNNPNLKSFAAYGGNGVVICKRWKSFGNFYADMGPKPSASHSVDRIDGSLGYSCGHCEECVSNDWTANCRWATPQEQSLNRSCVQMIEFNGVTQSIPAWAEQIGISEGTLHTRLSKGWSIERAFSTPANAHINMITFNGETLRLTDWAAKVGISLQTLHDRLKRYGWSVERALTQPVKKLNRSKS